MVVVTEDKYFFVPSVGSRSPNWRINVILINEVIDLCVIVLTLWLVYLKGWVRIKFQVEPSAKSDSISHGRGSCDVIFLVNPAPGRSDCVLVVSVEVYDYFFYIQIFDFGFVYVLAVLHPFLGPDS